MSLQGTGDFWKPETWPAPQGEIYGPPEAPPGTPTIFNSSGRPAYVAGGPSIGLWTEVPQDHKAQVGDVLRFRYRLGLPFLQDWQFSRLRRKLTADSRFDILYLETNHETRTLTAEVRLNSPFSPVQLVALAVAAVAVGVSIWLTVSSIEKLTTVKTPFGEINLGGIILAGIVTIFLTKALRG